MSFEQHRERLNSFDHVDCQLAHEELVVPLTLDNSGEPLQQPLCDEATQRKRPACAHGSAHNYVRDALMALRLSKMIDDDQYSEIGNDFSRIRRRITDVDTAVFEINRNVDTTELAKKRAAEARAKYSTCVEEMKGVCQKIIKILDEAIASRMAAAS